MVKIPPLFVDEVLWPQFESIARELEIYLNEVTDNVIEKAIQADSAEAEVVERNAGLKGGKLPLLRIIDSSESIPDSGNKDNNKEEDNESKAQSETGGADRKFFHAHEGRDRQGGTEKRSDSKHKSEKKKKKKKKKKRRRS